MGRTLVNYIRMELNRKGGKFEDMMIRMTDTVGRYAPGLLVLYGLKNKMKAEGLIESLNN